MGPNLRSRKNTRPIPEAPSVLKSKEKASGEKAKKAAVKTSSKSKNSRLNEKPCKTLKVTEQKESLRNISSSSKNRGQDLNATKTRRSSVRLLEKKSQEINNKLKSNSLTSSKSKENTKKISVNNISATNVSQNSGRLETLVKSQVKSDASLSKTRNGRKQQEIETISSSTSKLRESNSVTSTRSVLNDQSLESNVQRRSLRSTSSKKQKVDESLSKIGLNRCSMHQSPTGQTSPNVNNTTNSAMKSKRRAVVLQKPLHLKNQPSNSKKNKGIINLSSSIKVTGRKSNLSRSSAPKRLSRSNISPEKADDESPNRVVKQIFTRNVKKAIEQQEDDKNATNSLTSSTQRKARKSKEMKNSSIISERMNKVDLKQSSNITKQKITKNPQRNEDCIEKKSKRIANSTTRPKKHVQFDGGAETRALRKKKAQKLISDSDSDSLQATPKRVPVWRKPVKVPEKKTKDVYDLNIAEERRKNSDSDNYDKDIEEELKRIIRLEKKVAKKPAKRLKKSEKIKKLEGLPAKAKVQQKEKPVVLLENQVIRRRPPEPDKRCTVVNPASIAAMEISSLKPTDSIGFSASINIETRRNSDDDLNASPSHSIDDSYITFKKPIDKNFNSTMVPSRHIEQNAASSPWRPLLVYKNGPHLLDYKKSSLPAFSQDAVLDATMVAPVSSTPCKTSLTRGKSSKQASILKYVNSSRKVQEEIVHTLHENTLFDEHLLLSPVKSMKSPQKEAFKDRTNICNNILDTPEHQKSDVSDFLPSFLRGENPPAARTTGKPMRFPCHTTGSKKANLEKSLIEKVVDNEKTVSSIFESPVSQKNDQKSDETSPIIGIFQEYSEFPRAEPSFTYKNKNKKKRLVKFASRHSDSEEEDEASKKAMAKKKRPKDEMSKEEKKQYADWVKKFNKMCEEVEKFPLEIEEVSTNME